MTHDTDTDTLTLVAAYAPGAEQLDQDWPAADRAEMQAQIQTQSRQPRTGTAPLPARRYRKRWPAAAALVAAAAAALLVVQAVLPYDTRGGPTTAAADALENLAAAAQHTSADLIGPGEYHYLLAKQSTGSTQVTWTSDTGRTWRKSTYYDGTVAYFPPRERTDDLNNPSPKFLASLPTDPAKLQDYLRAHLTGSTSVEEAVFVWVGDTIRRGYTPPTLRAAAIRVLERTPHIAVQSSHDATGRDAIEVTFTDEVNRPDESQRLFFDPVSSELLQEQTVFAGKTSTTTYTESKIVDSVPSNVMKQAANPNQPSPPTPRGVGGLPTATYHK